MSKITPLPWSVFGYGSLGLGEDGGGIGICRRNSSKDIIFNQDVDGNLVCDAIGAEDAAFIVRACNSHDALVGALEELIKICGKLEEMATGRRTPLAKARVALALAKGEA